MASEDQLMSPSPLHAIDGNSVFAEPWQAQALAIADTLIQGGVFSNTAWSRALGNALKRSQAQGEKDDQENYYRCVLTALETLVVENSKVDSTVLIKKYRALAGEQHD